MKPHGPQICIACDDRLQVTPLKDHRTQHSETIKIEDSLDTHAP
jgi:hypothetical protein